MVSSILSYAGYKVGTYTSPHLSDYTERIVIKGKKIPEEEVVRLFDEMMPIAEKMEKEKKEGPSFFEFTTVLAIKYFCENSVDIAVMEVGLGGRLDATNVIDPMVSVITNIGLEHTDILGDTREKIAMEKAGIIKQGGRLVTAADPEIYNIFKEVCRERSSSIVGVGSDIMVKGREYSEESQTFDVEGFGTRYDNVELKLIGDHQLCNAGCAFGAVHVLNENGFDVPEEAFRSGLKNVMWPGRLEIMQRNPTVVLDCAKDPYGMKALREALLKTFKSRKLITIIGMSSDKNIPLMLDEIIPVSSAVIATKHHIAGRAFDPAVLAGMVSKYGKKAIVADSVDEALDIALKSSDSDSLICVTGSLFLVGEARERWHKEVVIWGREMNETRKA
jgi:dihydrofolate synthase/folylpolyglutamate synthase